MKMTKPFSHFRYSAAHIVYIVGHRAVLHQSHSGCNRIDNGFVVIVVRVGHIGKRRELRKDLIGHHIGLVICCCNNWRVQVAKRTAFKEDQVAISNAVSEKVSVDLCKASSLRTNVHRLRYTLARRGSLLDETPARQAEKVQRYLLTSRYSGIKWCLLVSRPES